MKEIEEDWNPMEDYEKYKCELLDELFRDVENERRTKRMGTDATEDR